MPYTPREGRKGNSHGGEQEACGKMKEAWAKGWRKKVYGEKEQAFDGRNDLAGCGKADAEEFATEEKQQLQKAYGKHDYAIEAKLFPLNRVEGGHDGSEHEY